MTGDKRTNHSIAHVRKNPAPGVTARGISFFRTASLRWMMPSPERVSKPTQHKVRFRNVRQFEIR